MYVGFAKLDPSWQGFAASLRKGQIYVKMPIEKARALGTVWDILCQRMPSVGTLHDVLISLFKLIEDETVGSQAYGIRSVFYSATVDSCQKDIEALDCFVAEDSTGAFKLFKEALEKGLQSDPEVDWIARVGGPQAHPFEALQRDSDPVGMSPLRGTDL